MQQAFVHGLPFNLKLKFINQKQSIKDRQADG